ncbi:MAG: CRISPR-associated helicase Cas3' [Candidatus Helarchaeota archaeon]
MREILSIFKESNTQNWTLLSHEDPPRLLSQHLKDVGIGCSQIFNENNLFFYIRKILDFSNQAEENNWKNLVNIFLFILGYCHDLGKATSFFQNYLKKRKEKYITRSEREEHSKISGVVAFVVMEQVLNEIALKIFKIKYKDIDFYQLDFKELLFCSLPVIMFFVISQHHINLSNFFSYVEDRLPIKNLKIQLEDLKVNKEFKNLLANLIKSIREFFQKYYDLKIQELNVGVILKNTSKILGETYPYVPDPDLKIAWEKLLMDNIRDEPHINEKGVSIFGFVKLCYSILLQSDKMNTVFGNWKVVEKTKVNFLERLDEYRIRRSFTLSEEKIEEINKKWKSTGKIEIDDLRGSIYYACLKYIKNMNSSRSSSSNNDILLLKIPTGLGKTLLSLGISFYFKKSNTRIIYSLPFLSILDQNYDITKEILFYGTQTYNSSLLLAQHHLSENKYTISFDNKNEATRKGKKNYDEINSLSFGGSEAQLLVEGWESHIIFTTFHQFLNTIFSNRNRLNRRFFAYFGSIVILDEIQTIPLKYWKLIRELLGFLNDAFNMNFIISTATLPKIVPAGKVIDLYEELYNFDDGRFSFIKDALQQLNRFTILYDTRSYTIDDFLEIFLEDIINHAKENGLLFILNTRRSARKLFDGVKDYLNNKYERNEKIALYFLSSEIIPRERMKIINSIKNNTKNVILISTQVVEAGVDIDFGYVIRDFCPLDSIIQAAGRCNRNAMNKGIMKIIRLVYQSDTSYASQIYDMVLLNYTKQCLLESRANQPINNTIYSYTESEIYEILLNYYVKIDKYKSNQEIINYNKFFKEMQFENMGEDFKLILDIGTYSFFIEYEDEATNIIKKWYETLKEKQKFKKISDLRDLSHRMNNYVINVYLKKAERKELYAKLKKFKIEFIPDGITIIPREHVDSFYCKTGLLLVD